jgi:muramidase (phage lysozyme)
VPRTTTLAANVAAFLDMIAWSEIGSKLLAVSDDGYNVIVGSIPAKPILFTDYSQHPQKHNQAMNSDAAGRYQFMGRYWSAYKLQLSLPDFGPESQDRWAVQLIKECKALDDVLTGHVDKAVAKCSSRWASLPGNSYGQRMNALASLEDAYERGGGTFA